MTTSREPIFNAPVLALAPPAMLILLFCAQSFTAAGAGWLQLYALSPQLVVQGQYLGLLTHIGLHASWTHVLVNSLGCVAFGAPIARMMRPGVWGGVGYISFFLLCGLGGGLAFVALNLHRDAAAAGASGAASGLMGAAVRLLGRRSGLTSLWARNIVLTSLAFCIANVGLALIAYMPGLGVGAIAWECHLGGYFTGLVLISPWKAVFGRSDVALQQ